MRLRVLACVFVSALALAACGDDDDDNPKPGGAGSGGSAGKGGSSSTGGSGGTGGSVAGSGGTAGAPVSDMTQASLDALAQALQVRFEVLVNVPATCPSNAPDGLCVEAKLTLKNTGEAFNAKSWKLYYSGIRKILASENPEFTINHVNGDLHVIEPTPLFSGFAAGATKSISLQAEFWMMSESDLMPRFYVASDGLVAKSVGNTNTEELPQFVAPFTRPENQRRHPADQSIIATAATRHTENAPIADLGASAVASQIIPKPRSLALATGTLDLAAGVRFTGALSAAEIDVVKARLTGHINVVAAAGVEVNVTVDAANAAFTSDKTPEGYTLTVGDAGVTIVGIDAAGAFYGVQSLVGLLSGDVTVKTIPKLKIDHDAPRYGYRGVQLDLARNFHGIETINKVLDQMAAYKLNTLHLHLTDDEGWRLEIPALPELTTIGGKRCHDLTEKTCLIPQLGSGPDTTTSGTGHLTRAQFVQILTAAKVRHIEVIPEFDMPGHARAAIKSMEARAAASGDAAYLLSDPEDKSVYHSIQNYKDNAINACMDSTYAFIGKVMDEVKAMYTEAGATLKTWHVGGDEVGGGAWAESPKCKALIATNGPVKSVADIQAYFVAKANKLAKDRGFGLRGWQDGLRKTVTGGDGKPTKVFLDITTDLESNAVSVNYWTPTFWWGNEAHILANANYKVVLTNPDYLYFDQPYEADPKERGYYWATRYTNVRKLFSYISGNLPTNSLLYPDRMGGNYNASFAPTTANPTPVIPIQDAKRGNIIGLEGAMWGETMRTADQVEYMVFPRFLSFAERAWSRASWEPADNAAYNVVLNTAGLEDDWERFANTVGYKELPKLDRAGIRYRVEVPGAKIVDGKLDANVALPGVKIQYKAANGTWTNYDDAAPPTIASTEVRGISSNNREGRAITVP